MFFMLLIHDEHKEISRLKISGINDREAIRVS